MAGLLARAFYLAAAANLAACATTHSAHEPAPSIGPPAPKQTDSPKQHWWHSVWQDFREEPAAAKAAYIVSAGGALFLADTFLHHYGNTNSTTQGGGGSVCPPGTVFTPVANATNSSVGGSPGYSCVYQNSAGIKRSARALSFQFGKAW